MKRHRSGSDLIIVNSKHTIIVGASAPDVIKLIEAINRAGTEDIRIEGFLDDDARKHGTSFMNYPVLGSVDLLNSKLRDCYVVNNIAGDMKVRQSIVARLNHFPRIKHLTLVHPSVDIERCSIGQGCIIQEQVVLGGECSIGNHCVLYADCVIGHETTIGDLVFVANKAIVGARGSIRTGAFIGLGSVVIPYVHVGEWATVGAGSIVLRDVAAGSTVFGNPARAGVQPGIARAEAS